MSIYALAGRNLVLVLNRKIVRVYAINTTGEPCAVFEQHDIRVSDAAQVNGDVVASVGQYAKLFTCHATTTELVGK